MAQSVRIIREYSHPPERVWSALADTNALAAWLMPNTFQPVLHHKFQFFAPPRPGFSGVVECEVLEIVHARVLAYSWQGGPMKHPTTVRWTLEELPNGNTLLTLEHSGFEGLSGVLVRTILGFGWKDLLQKKIAEYLLTVSPQ